MAAGVLQTCAGHDAGAEAAIHAMREIFAHENTDAVLLVDASNAFNQVNRQSALHNISIMCPSFATILKNTYGVPIRLFITGEGEIASTEGTTQGDPLAMAMYALAVTPLIRSLLSLSRMFHRCGMQMMPLREDNLLFYCIGGNIFWLMALCMATFQMLLKHAS